MHRVENRVPVASRSILLSLELKAREIHPQRGAHRGEVPVCSSDLWDLTHPVLVNSEEQHTDDGSDEREDGDDDDYGDYEEDNDYDFSRCLVGK